MFWVHKSLMSLEMFLLRAQNVCLVEKKPHNNHFLGVMYLCLPPYNSNYSQPANNESPPIKGHFYFPTKIPFFIGK